METEWFWTCLPATAADKQQEAVHNADHCLEQLKRKTSEAHEALRSRAGGDPAPAIIIELRSLLRNLPLLWGRQPVASPFDISAFAGAPCRYSSLSSTAFPQSWSHMLSSDVQHEPCVAALAERLDLAEQAPHLANPETDILK